MNQPSIGFSYKPGTGARFYNTVKTVDGLLTDPPTLTMVVCAPDRATQLTGTITRVSTGTYYADVLIPLNAAPGVWIARWQSSGVPIEANRLQEYPFRVEALDF